MRRLRDYQDDAYANRYSKLVDCVHAMELGLLGAAGQPGCSATPELTPRLPLTEAVARNYFKVLAYKDEIEVLCLRARLKAPPPRPTSAQRSVPAALVLLTDLPKLGTGAMARFSRIEECQDTEVLALNAGVAAASESWALGSSAFS